MSKVINGELFKNMMTLAASAVEESKEQLNSLNVFPVPDGDTGTNMTMTISRKFNMENKDINLYDIFIRYSYYDIMKLLGVDRIKDRINIL